MRMRIGTALVISPGLDREQNRRLISSKSYHCQNRSFSARRAFEFHIYRNTICYATSLASILEVMAPIAKAHECSPARLSRAWLLEKPVVTSVVSVQKLCEGSQ
jgi:hypothetical protein